MYVPGLRMPPFLLLCELGAWKRESYSEGEKAKT